jgi:hypothetical protein
MNTPPQSSGPKSKPSNQEETGDKERQWFGRTKLADRTKYRGRRGRDAGTPVVSKTPSEDDPMGSKHVKEKQ